MNTSIFSPIFICTDSSTNQHGRWLGDNVFEFYEHSPLTSRQIDLSSYSMNEVEGYINSYGYTLYLETGGNVNIVLQYGNYWPWIVAECIFESII